MDIERLTKSQIVLLVLLVSFVTSIATGIVTVTLLEEAPPVVTQTINRVVEHTVERVVPGETQTATVVETEKTVVVNEEDLITQAISKNADKIVKIYQQSAEGPLYLGGGAIVSKDGVVAAVTDRSILNVPGPFTVLLSNGREVAAKVVKDGSDKPTALLQLTFTEDDGVVPGSIKYADINALKLGQSVLTIYGRARVSVALGIISGLNEEKTEVKKEPDTSQEEGETALVSVLKAVETNINTDSVEKGGILLNIFGEVVGISTSQSRITGGGNFTPIQVVQSQIVELALLSSKAGGEEVNR